MDVDIHDIWKKDIYSEETDRAKSRRGLFFSENKVPGKSKICLRPPSARAFPLSIPKTSGVLPFVDKSNQNQAERLVSQQGINFLRTSTSHGQRNRAIRDKRYFEGALQLKIGEINIELNKMRKEMEKNTREQSAIGIYNKKVKQLATELTDLQRSLAEYNTAIDKVNVGSDATMILCAAKDLARINDADVLSLENLYTERTKKQEHLKLLQQQIDKGHEQLKKLENEMSPNQKILFERLKQQKFDLNSKVAELESELGLLSKTKSSILDQAFISPEKMEQIQMELKVYELEKTREKVIDELQSNLSPEEQRRDLLNKVKEDKAQASAIQKAVNDVKEQIKEAESTLAQSDDILGGKSSRQVKMIELKTKEKGIDDFLSSVEKMMSNESDKLSALQNEILVLVNGFAEKISVVPTPADYKALQCGNQPMMKTVTKTPSVEHLNASRYLSKMEVMNKNVKDHSNKITDRIKGMQGEIKIFSNLVQLEEEFDTKRVTLLKEKAELSADRPMTKSIWLDTLNCFNDMQKALADSEMYGILSNCEKKLSVVQESNFAIEDYLDEVLHEEDISVRKAKALEIVDRLNDRLINKLK